MKTIIYGDSLAGNYGIAPDKAWPDLIAEHEAKDMIKVVFINGATTSDLLERLNREVLDHAPDRVLFIAGTNDALRMKDSESIAAGIKFMAREIAKTGAIPIWLIPPQLDIEEVIRVYGDPPKLVQDAAETISRLRALIKADSLDFKVIDLEEIRQEYLIDHEKTYWDGIHFHTQFHRYLAEKLSERI